MLTTLYSRTEAALLSMWAGISIFMGWAFGGLSVSIIWLLVFAAADYITGLFAAYKTSTWSSEQGFKGIFKKILMFALTALCHGLDVITGMSVFMGAAVLAYSINEAISILENLTRAGYGSVIPAVMRRGLKMLKNKDDATFAEPKKAAPPAASEEKKESKNGKT